METRYIPPGNKSHAPLSHPAKRRLPKVRHSPSPISISQYSPTSRMAPNQCLVPIPVQILTSFPLIIKLTPTPSVPRYNKLCGAIRSFAHRLSLLPAQDPFRSKFEAQILAKLYDIGVLNSTAKLSDVENKLTVSAFCRRRLAVVMCVAKMAETVSAVSLILIALPFPWFPHCAATHSCFFICDPCVFVPV